MKDYRNNQFPEHDRTSCNDENLANVDPDGSGCRRCNALLFNRYEELLEEVQALRKDADRYRVALQAIVGDLEMRSMWKDAPNTGVVDCGHGVYMTAKEALGEAGTSIGGVNAAMEMQL